MEYINLENQIRNSDSSLLKSLPRFIIKILSKIIYQKEINRILNKYADKQDAEFLTCVQKELNIHLDVKGIENLPESGKCFFVANHPFGFVDGLALTTIVSGKYGTFKAIGNELFMLIPHFKHSIAAVNVFGSTPKEYLLELDKVFYSNDPVTHFPAGKVSRIKRWKIRDEAWQKSFISKAVLCERNIVPFYFSGRNSNLFYSVYILRNLLGIKANLELALLPHEIFNKRNKTIRVVIGKPIPYHIFDKSRSYSEWAQHVMKQVYLLKN
jgi:putative hemolysin